MGQHVITISEDVIKNVVKPLSLFLNDVAVGAVFTHIPDSKIKEYKMDGKIPPSYKFACSKGGTFKFSTYDLRNFSTKGIKFNDYFVPKTGETCFLRTVFTVTKCFPLLIDNEKVYPLFCYEGFEKFAAEKKALQDEDKYPTEAMYKLLMGSGLKDSATERYYRTVEIDSEIFYYDDVVETKK